MKGATPVILFHSPDDPVDLWVPELQRQMPDTEIRVSPDVGEAAEVDYALVWKPPPGLLATLPNLRAILSIAAGIDHILADPERPVHLPIVRMVDPNLRDMMSEYALLGVLYFHRFMPEYLDERPLRQWDRRWPVYTPETTVGVLGLGAIGADVARKLRIMGFQVHGWSRTPREVPGIACHHGRDGLARMLPDCRYLVCVLPLTDDTRGIIDADLIGRLPPDAVVLNLGRGGHVVDHDLLAALDSGHLRGAFLDVFHQEPLAADHPYWRHPKVVMTPHVAGELVPQSCARSVARNVRADLAGEPMSGVVDLDRGY